MNEVLKKSLGTVSDDSSIRTKNTIFIGGGKDMSLLEIADDDDQFVDFSFLKNVKPVPVMTMQQIFVLEKGEEHLRT